MTLHADEFLRRFLMHVLPRGFVKIRHCGLLANRRRENNLGRFRMLLVVAKLAQHACTITPAPKPQQPIACPVCGTGTLLRVRLVVPPVPHDTS